LFFHKSGKQIPAETGREVGIHSRRRGKLKNTMNPEFAAIPADGALGALDKVLASQRRRMTEAFARFRGEEPGQTVLEVGMIPAPGVTPAAAGDGALVERAGVTSCVIASSVLRRPPHIVDARAAHASAAPVESRHLPFADNEFDWVYCSEVIEHAGSFERQYELLKELLRVSRKGIFVTTPNRWHPLEFNTRAPFLHWLPMAWWRRLLKWSGKSLWASESVLNLLDAHELKNLTALLPCSPKYEIGHLRVMGLKAHFFLQIRKGSGVKQDKK
jgi:hypothetical protein